MMKLSPIMHGDCMKIESKINKVGYALKRESFILNENEISDTKTYYEIDGKVDIIFDANSKYNTFWFFPN